MTFSGGYFCGILIKTISPKVFPYFETKYYVSGPPYYDSDYELIKREEIAYRTIVPGIMGEVLYYRTIGKKVDFMLGIHGRLLTHSIYYKHAQVSEKAMTEGIAMGFRYNIR